jgi:hypothetical protein
MQYVMLIYQGSTPLPNTPEWDTLSADEQQAVYADYAALNAMDNVEPGLPLGLAGDATTVRVTDGTAQPSSGPYVDEKGAVSGYLVVEAADLDAAVAIAAGVPAARLGGAVEVRPVSKYW